MRAVWAIALAGILGASCLRAAADAQPASTSAPALSESQELELRTLVGQLTDQSREYRTKVEAAELLLMRAYPQATEALRDALCDTGNRAAQMAVAEAIARRGAARDLFLEPLMRMLTGEEQSLRLPAARALALYRSAAVTSRLVSIAADPKGDRQTRLVTITVLQNVLVRASIDTLVTLLDDSDASIRDAAAESLTAMTGIKPTPTDPHPWRQWWRVNREREPSMWLADLAEGLGRSKASLEAENTALKSRLARALTELYEAASPAQRDALLVGFLRDPLVEVRLAGLAILGRRAQNGDIASADVRAQVRSLGADTDYRVRQSVALLLPALGEAQLSTFLEALRTEDNPSVRAALLTGLGLTRDPKALDPVLAELRDHKYDSVAIAAAGALAKIASKQPLAPAQQQQALEVLKVRYEQAARQGDGAPLREALLAAMGALGQRQALPLLESALKDTNASVRQAAVDATSKLGEPASADSLAPLVSDADRGVRSAAIVALATLGAEKHVDTVLQRTDPSIEPDAAVRQAAQEALLALLSKADDSQLLTVADALAARDDAQELRAKLLQLRVANLKTQKSDKLPAAQRALAAALIKALRPADAAACLGEAYAAMAQSGDAEASRVWNDWVDALLAADDMVAVKALADQKDPEQFQAAYKRLALRLTALLEKDKAAPSVALADEAIKQIGPRLSEGDRAWLAQTLADARGKQLAADRQRVAKLAAGLTSGDEAARKSAAAELAGMGDRALEPLLLELKRCLAADKPNADLERAILAVVRQTAPKLEGYDVDAPPGARIKCIDAWLASLK